MRKPLLLLSAVLLATTPLSTALADDAAARKGITQAIDKSFAAGKKKDLKGFMAVMTPDYTQKMQGMTMDRKQVETEMAQHFKDTKTINKLTYTIKSLKTQGDKASVNATSVVDVVAVDSQGMMGKKGATRRLVMVDQSKDTWVKTSGGWKLQRSESTAPTKMTVDGKPFAMPGAPPQTSRPAK